MKENLWVRDAELLHLAAQLNRLTLSEQPEEGTIPHIAHFIWIGCKPLPGYAQACIARFAEIHPSWRVQLWDDSSVSALRWTLHEDAFRSATNLGM